MRDELLSERLFVDLGQLRQLIDGDCVTDTTPRGRVHRLSTKRGLHSCAEVRNLAEALSAAQ